MTPLARLLCGGLTPTLVALLALTGCDIDPFCLEGSCESASAGSGLEDSGPPDGSPDGGSGGRNVDSGQDDDGSVSSGCDPRLDELCNDFDDNCNGEVDEGFDLTSDIRNCGDCGNQCILHHALPACQDGQCVIDQCDVCYHDLDGQDDNGCEYGRCCPTDTPSEDPYCLGGIDCCDTKDNNCDGQLNEDHDLLADPNNCGGCLDQCEDDECRAQRRCSFPFAEASCRDGRCVMGRCVDGRADADDDPSNGCEAICTPNGETGGVEVCNGINDDCDLLVDEDIPNVGQACTTADNSCQPGTWACIRGSMVCEDELLPGREICDGINNDCDSTTADGADDPALLRPCGNGVGECTKGRNECVSGEIQCVGGNNPVDEICDGLDNDCNGVPDNDVTDTPSPGDRLWPCDTNEGLCVLGAPACLGGNWTCQGATGRTQEICDGEDNDCDGETDEDFDFDTDPLHCGDCDTSCENAFPNAVSLCVRADGAERAECVLQTCEANYHDFITDDPTDTSTLGCETFCRITGSSAETCDGVDNDCNGSVDDWTPPDRYCLAFGVCAGVTVECGDPQDTGSIDPYCDYPSTYEEDEATCDGLDNDCDGRVDEGFDVGHPCDNEGVGRCRTTGTIACACPSGTPASRCLNITGSSAVCVLTAAPASATDELCNGIDDNCDGHIDNGIAMTDMNLVEVTADADLDGDGDTSGTDEAGRTFFVFQYEASHPDASDSDGGSVWSYACSNSDVVPWAMVSWRDAQDACCGLNPNGNCLYQTATASSGPVVVPSGWALCTAGDWQAACQGGSSGNTYPYGDTYGTENCNGTDSDNGEPLVTSSLDTCQGGGDEWGVDHFDMSGNLHEWTFTGTPYCSCSDGSCDDGSDSDRLDDDCPCEPTCRCTCDSDSSAQVGRCQVNQAGTGPCPCDPDCNTYYEYRGGSYQNAAPGLACQFNFNVGIDRSDDPDPSDDNVDPIAGLALESLGFRCCYYPTP